MPVVSSVSEWLTNVSYESTLRPHILFQIYVNIILLPEQYE